MCCRIFFVEKACKDFFFSTIPVSNSPLRLHFHSYNLYHSLSYPTHNIRDVQEKLNVNHLFNFHARKLLPFFPPTSLPVTYYWALFILQILEPPHSFYLPGRGPRVLNVHLTDYRWWTFFCWSFRIFIYCKKYSSKVYVFVVTYRRQELVLMHFWVNIKESCNFFDKKIIYIYIR